MAKSRNSFGAALKQSEPLRLAATLSAFDVTMLVMGCIIGAGIFSTPRHIAAAAPSIWGVIGLWAAGGVIGISGALVFAELGTRLPHPGGQYVFLREAFGRFVAFIYGWLLLTAICSAAIAFIARVAVDHVDTFLQSTLGTGAIPPVAATLTAVAIIAGFSWLNILGVKLGARVQNVAMMAKIGGIVLVLCAGLAVACGWVEPGGAARVAADRPEPPLPPDAWTTQALFAALLSVAFSYGGWQNAAAIAGEIREPQRTLPKAILIGTLAVVFLYVTLNASLVAILTPAGLATANTPVASAFGAVFPKGDALIALLVVVSTLAITQALIMVTPRIYFAMASDGVFLPIFARIHPRYRTPAAAIVLQGGFATLHLFLGDKLDLLQCATLADWSAFLLCGWALFVLRRRPSTCGPGFRVPAYPWVPLIFMGCAATIVASALVAAEARAAARAGVLLLIGVAVYFLSPQQHRQSNR